MILQILLLRIVWTAVYAASPERAGAVTLPEMVSYATLSSLQFWLFNPGNVSPIPKRVRDGKIAVDLVRPVGFLGQIVSGQLGSIAALAPFLLLALPFAALAGSLQASESVSDTTAFAASLLFGLIISVLLSSIVGLAAFWTLEVGGLFMIYQVISQFFSGALVPLWFMPGWLRTVAQMLPFQAVTYTPSAIYLGQISHYALLSQILWVVVLWCILRLVWARALNRVVVQGG
ncbi:ABC transporter permease [Nonomuraea glycinis]|uniref:ABC transporter permease n=1 Tax=Nonomuraea glycinis TaxID=2047744 RepID=UPI00339F1E7D